MAHAIHACPVETRPDTLLALPLRFAFSRRTSTIFASIFRLADSMPILFSGGGQHLLLQPSRHKESVASAQRLNLWPYSFDLAIVLGS
jgi:hypothetical protein